MWQKAAKPYVDAGKLTVIGVVQEQHADRARLYRQWRKLKWPIFVDSLNLLDIAVVPVPVAIDESGIVRHDRLRPSQLGSKFIDVEYPRTADAALPDRAEMSDLAKLRESARSNKTTRAWRDLGDSCFLLRHGLQHTAETDANTTCDPVEAYEQAVAQAPSDGRSHFRLGVALRARYESRRRQVGDGQAAVEHWGEALAINPNQYIWRRRIQQYGPRLDKPYNFYFWVKEAREAITARGEEPVALAVEPGGSELAAPARGPIAAGAGEASPQVGTGGTIDPAADRIQRDTQPMVAVESVVTPARVQPGQRVRVRTTFRLSERTRPFWNNEADDLTMWIDLPRLSGLSGRTVGLTLGEGVLRYPNPSRPGGRDGITGGQPETQEVRAVEFEVVVGRDAKPGPHVLPAYALYYVCENKGGKCRYLRHDFVVTVEVDPSAASLR